MADFQKEKNILHQLVKARDAIRRKHRLLKFGRDDVSRVLGETFKPIRYVQAKRGDLRIDRPAHGGGIGKLGGQLSIAHTLITVKIMGNNKCCIINCKNNSRNSVVKFYRFPTLTSYQSVQRLEWIAAVRRVNGDEFSWTPKKYDTICSAHFIGGEKSNEIDSPNYVPTIFSSVQKKSTINETAVLQRYKRVRQRRMKKWLVKDIPKKKLHQLHEDMDTVENDYLIEDDIVNQVSEKECQAEIFFEENASQFVETFTCNSFIYVGHSYSDAQTQTDIPSMTRAKKILSVKQYKEKGCNTEKRETVEKGTGPDVDMNHTKFDEYTGLRFEYIKCNEALLDLCGVSFENFNFLLDRIDEGQRKSISSFKISKQNKLLILLMKIKTGLTFSAISVILNVHRTTVSRIFFTILKIMSATTANLVFWPEREVVQATMPDCFRPKYSNVRVIIDCTEFRIDVPSSVENRVYCYSHYKKGFTAKLLVGILPSGFICFKSKVAGGRKSDSQITIDSGLIDKMQDGDEILSDKGFPEIVRVIDEKGKNVIVVMPPFLEKKSEFTKEEADNTYKIASVRIHVERIMQRLRTHKILDKIHENLFYYIDDIIHICCVLVNLQPPIIADKKSDMNLL